MLRTLKNRRKDLRAYVLFPFDQLLSKGEYHPLALGLGHRLLLDDVCSRPWGFDNEVVVDLWEIFLLEWALVRECELWREWILFREWLLFGESKVDMDLRELLGFIGATDALDLIGLKELGKNSFFFLLSVELLVGLEMMDTNGGLRDFLSDREGSCGGLESHLLDVFPPLRLLGLLVMLSSSDMGMVLV